VLTRRYFDSFARPGITDPEAYIQAIEHGGESVRSSGQFGTLGQEHEAALEQQVRSSTVAPALAPVQLKSAH
jgi:hypothetical protein